MDSLDSAENELDVDAMLIGRLLSVGSALEGLHGFTSHEMLDEIDLIHMNARVYDPELGRFSTPDTIIPDPSKPLALNRSQNGQSP